MMDDVLWMCLLGIRNTVKNSNSNRKRHHPKSQHYFSPNELFYYLRNNFREVHPVHRSHVSSTGYRAQVFLYTLKIARLTCEVVEVSKGKIERLSQSLYEPQMIFQH